MESSRPLNQSWESLSSCASNDCNDGEEDWVTSNSPQAMATGDARSQSLSDSWCEVDSEVAVADASATGDEFSLVDEGDDAHSATTLSWSVVDGQDGVVSMSTTPMTTPRATAEAFPPRNAHPRLPQHVILGHVYGVPAMSHLTQPCFPPANVNVVPKAARHLPTRAQVPSQTSSAMLRRTGHLCQPKGRYRPGHKQGKVAPRQRGPN